MRFEILEVSMEGFSHLSDYTALHAGRWQS